MRPTAFAYSSTACFTRWPSGFTTGSNTFSISPVLPIRILVKFQRGSTSTTPFCCWCASHWYSGWASSPTTSCRAATGKLSWYCCTNCCISSLLPGSILLKLLLGMAITTRLLAYCCCNCCSSAYCGACWHWLAVFTNNIFLPV